MFYKESIMQKNTKDSFRTDREIMQDIGNSISVIMDRLNSGDTVSKDDLLPELQRAKEQIHIVTTASINYQIVVDHLDENVMITDSDQTILYVNPSFEHSFNISRHELIGSPLSSLVASGRYFTNPIVSEVIRDKRRIMRLAFLPNNERPSIAVGFPIFDAEGKILYVVSTDRSLSSFSDLRDHFNSFVSSLRSIHQMGSAVKVYDSAKMIAGEDPMIGSSPQMKQIQYLVEKVSDTDAPVLITGESGTGKELVANAIYNSSKRKNKPFIKVNCSSIPATLIESELFGYEKGAFSGASTSGKKGLFEAANEGTILLDEIGDMPLEAQAKLLRVLQNNEVTRVGGTRPIKLNIRVIASTNSDLKAKIQEGTFRKDLYYRLHIIPISIPPLRERQDDIALLCDHFIRMFSEQYHRSFSMTDENLELLTSYSWPGNIRELRNIMEYLVVCCSDFPYVDNSLLKGILDIEEDPEDLSPVSVSDTNETAGELTLGEAVAKCERDLLKSTMQKVSSMKEASLLLGVDTSTISRKLKQYGLTIKGEEA